MSDKKILSNEKVKASVLRNSKELQLALNYVEDVAMDVYDLFPRVLFENDIERYLDYYSKSNFSLEIGRILGKLRKQSDGGVDDNVLHIVINDIGGGTMGLSVEVDPLGGKKRSGSVADFKFNR